jgi:hypothetical protein
VPQQQQSNDEDRPSMDIGDLIDNQFGATSAERYRRGEALVLALRAKIDQLDAAMRGQAGPPADNPLFVAEVERRYRGYVRELRVMAFLAVIYPMRRDVRTIREALRVLALDTSAFPADFADLSNEQLHDLQIKVDAWLGSLAESVPSRRVGRLDRAP